MNRVQGSNRRYGPSRHRARQIIGWLAGIAVILGQLAIAVPLPARADDGPAASLRPNILVYIVDTLRADGLGFLRRGPLGRNTAKTKTPATPHFDRFAESGVVFENAFTNASWTRAAIASLLTGLYPWHHGAEERNQVLSSEIETLTDRLRPLGYRTAMVVSNPNVGSVFGFDQSVDHFVELYERRAKGDVAGHELVATSEDVNREALAWLGSVEEPFVLVMLSVDPHDPYRPPPEFDPGTLRDRTPITGDYESLRRRDLDAIDRARIRELYHGEIARNDDAFGKLIAALTEMGRIENTIAVLTADHGEEFWEYGVRGHGMSLNEQEIHIPLVIHYPGSARVVAGTRVREPVSLVDVVPTLLDLARLPEAPDLDGRSLFQAALPPRDEVVSGLKLGGRHLWAVRQHPWKLVYDQKSNTASLYDLRRPESEATAIDAESTPESAQAHERLGRTLDATLEADRAQVRAQRQETIKKLPEDVQAALRALGYIE